MWNCNIAMTTQNYFWAVFLFKGKRIQVFLVFRISAFVPEPDGPAWLLRRNPLYKRRTLSSHTFLLNSQLPKSNASKSSRDWLTGWLRGARALWEEESTVWEPRDHSPYIDIDISMSIDMEMTMSIDISYRLEIKAQACCIFHPVLRAFCTLRSCRKPLPLSCDPSRHTHTLPIFF